MTNPVDESDEIENVDSADEVVSDADAVLPLEEEIPGDDESKPVKKKILALEARHKIEDYEIEKQIREALDYLDDGKSPKKYFEYIEKTPASHKIKPANVKASAQVKKAAIAVQPQVSKTVQVNKTQHTKSETKPKMPVKPKPIAKPKAKIHPKASPKNNHKPKAIKAKQTLKSKSSHTSKKIVKPVKKVKKAKKK
jgi:hypothetical protein